MKNIKRKTFFLFVFVLSVYAFACIAHTQENPETQTNNNCLWSIKTEKNTVYLLGSIHILKSDSFPPAREFEKAYDDCDKIVLEADIGSLSDPEFQAKMMTLGLYLEGETLKQNISEETYALFESKAAGIGLPAAQFQCFRPWLCGLMLTVMELQRLGFNQDYGIDNYFYNKAKQDEKELDFLETAEFQINLLAQMSAQEQELFLKQTLKDLNVMETSMNDLVSAWKAGDSNKLNLLIKEGFEGFPDIYNRFIIQRNKNWIPKIETLTRQNENVLVIVGAAHLVGAEGLVEFFKKRGYVIEQQ
ncbi:MAG: TraB/GumN family protein [Candidatus Omnitrophica bacterium]|nr:TraB/GumN family protein [Candidatus Omnitrophota bacterium]